MVDQIIQKLYCGVLSLQMKPYLTTTSGVWQHAKSGFQAIERGVRLLLEKTIDSSLGARKSLELGTFGMLGALITNIVDNMLTLGVGLSLWLRTGSKSGLGISASLGGLVFAALAHGDDIVLFQDLQTGRGMIDDLTPSLTKKKGGLLLVLHRSRGCLLTPRTLITHEIDDVEIGTSDGLVILGSWIKRDVSSADDMTRRTGLLAKPFMPTGISSGERTQVAQ